MSEHESYLCEEEGCDQEPEECRMIQPPGMEFDGIEYLCATHATLKGYWRDPDSGLFVQWE